MKASDKITDRALKVVLYNGVSEDFVEFSAAEKAAVRERYGLAPEDRVVAFVGNLVPVKNVMVLPELFAKIAAGFAGSGSVSGSGSLKFWIVGDGKLRSALETSFTNHGFEPVSSSPGSVSSRPSPTLSSRPNPTMSFRPNEVSGEISFFGNVPPADMPAIMNCIDLLVLPSLNEGLPLVCAEALRCGANVVGSDAGGIAEVIGADSVVPLGDTFVDTLTQKALSYLSARSLHPTSDPDSNRGSVPGPGSDPVPAPASGSDPVHGPDSVPGAHRQTLSEDFSWSRTAARELNFLMSL